ncbi:MAG: hypothetical protein JSW71_03530 [Gemmatimonadota bacterium]|nr:MAG: hypothetical protein JSW71_03530 [Gemmatimonadota bacterium]
MRPATLVLSVLFLVLPLAATASAQDNGRGNRKKSAAAVQVTSGFSSSERQVITAYFTTHAYAPEMLPPGIVKKLARGKPLPPGIAKRSLPQDLVAELPTREGFEITIFGDRIVLLEASGLVVDILEGIFDYTTPLRSAGKVLLGEVVEVSE